VWPGGKREAEDPHPKYRYCKEKEHLRKPFGLPRWGKKRKKSTSKKLYFVSLPYQGSILKIGKNLGSPKSPHRDWKVKKEGSTDDGIYRSRGRGAKE